MTYALDLARARYRCGDVDEALRLCARAVQEARRSGDVNAMAAAATLLRRPTDPLTRAIVHALAAEAMVGLTGQPELHESVRAQWVATRNAFHPDPSPEVVDDPEAAFVSLQATVELARDARDAAAMVAAGTRAIAIGLGNGGPEYEAWGRSWRMDAQAYTGDRPALLEELAALTPLAQRVGMPWTGHVLLARGAQAALEGRFDDALRTVAEAKALGGDATYLDLVFRSSVSHLKGGDPSVVDEVRAVVEHLPFAARGWLCQALESVGEREPATAIWRQLREHLVFPPDVPEALIGLVGAAGTCVWLRDAETAAALHGQLLPFAGLHAAGHAHTPYEGPVDLALGRLARVLGRKDDARRHLEAARESCVVLGARPFEALALAELSELDHPRSRARQEHAARAFDIAERLGMKPLTARVGTLMPAVAPGAALSSRELEVAVFVAEGLTNAAIGARLYLSERTVESHVSRIMIKLGVDSRTAIASWAARL